MILRRHTHIAICLFSVAACGDLVGPALSDLERARSKWDAAHLSQYEFDFVQHCGECPPGVGVPYHVRVFANGTITMTNIQTGSNPPDYVERPTVPGLFARIETTLRNNPNTFHAEYDATLGYPSAVSVDLSKNVIDDEWGFGISNLRAF